MSIADHLSFEDYIAGGGEPIRPGFYRTRRKGDAGWVEIEIKPNPRGDFEFIAIDGRGNVCNAEDVWTRCVEHPSSAEAFRATIVKKVNHTMEATSVPLQSEAISKIAEALAKAQSILANVPRNREVEVKKDGKVTYTFTYATLDAILDAVRPVLSQHGLAFVQSLLPAGKLVLVTTLAHSSGEWLRSYLPIESGGQNSQALGSAITYAKRYALTAMLGIAAEDDEDANVADGNTVKRLEPAARTAPSASPKTLSTPPAKAETPEQKRARWWAGDDLKVPKLRSSWQEWTDRVLNIIASAPDKARLDQFIADNAYELDGLRAEVPKAHANISAAVKSWAPAPTIAAE